MNRFIDKAYYSSPIFVQNVMVSIYGMSLKNRRFEGRSSEYFDELLKTQYFSASEIEEYQNVEFRKIVKHALETVPHYKKWSRESGVSINDIKDMRDVNKLPVITKEQIRRNPKQFCSIAFLNKRGLFELNTSGTTGTPLTIYCDKESRRRHYAFFSRLRSWFNVVQGDKRATLFGRIIAAPEQKKPPFWRYDINQKNMLFSSYHLSEENLRFYYEKLKDYRPDEIIGYPSSIFLIAKHMKKNKLNKILAKAVITTAETLLKHQRDLIEEQFDCPVVDQYGCTEMTHFVSQCEHGTYHVHPEHGLVEVLDKNNESVPGGYSGEAVCTGYINYAMPLIRYEMGDILTPGTMGCECGRNFPVIEQITGRIDDILVAPDGRPLGRMDPVFKGLSGIYETQIIQTANDCIELKMVVDNNFSEKNKDELVREIKKRVGHEMHIKINIVDSMPKDENGKFSAVISNIKK
jgi:phenylacetate-CoA ligase